MNGGAAKFSRAPVVINFIFTYHQVLQHQEELFLQ